MNKINYNFNIINVIYSLQLKYILKKCIYNILIKNFIIIIKSNKNSFIFLLNFLKQHFLSKATTLIDIIAIDNILKKKRFNLIYNILSTIYNRRFLISINIFETSKIFSIVKIFPSSNWYEREIWDMFGIFFSTNLDLRRLLTDYNFKGHPLRKDFPLSGYVELFYSSIFSKILYSKVNLKQKYKIVTNYYNTKNTTNKKKVINFLSFCFISLPFEGSITVSKYYSFIDPNYSYYYLTENSTQFIFFLLYFFALFIQIPIIKDFFETFENKDNVEILQLNRISSPFIYIVKFLYPDHFSELDNNLLKTHIDKFIRHLIFFQIIFSLILFFLFCVRISFITFFLWFLSFFISFFDVFIFQPQIIKLKKEKELEDERQVEYKKIDDFLKKEKDEYIIELQTREPGITMEQINERIDPILEDKRKTLRIDVDNALKEKYEEPVWFLGVDTSDPKVRKRLSKTASTEEFWDTKDFTQILNLNVKKKNLKIYNFFLFFPFLVFFLSSNLDLCLLFLSFFNDSNILYENNYKKIDKYDMYLRNIFK